MNVFGLNCSGNGLDVIEFNQWSGNITLITIINNMAVSKTNGSTEKVFIARDKINKFYERQTDPQHCLFIWIKVDF